MDEFGEELRRLRKVAGLSLRSLADRVAFDYSYLAQVERGVRTGSADLARQVDEALGAHGRLSVLFTRSRQAAPPARAEAPRRRVVLQAMTALASGVSMPLVSLEATRQGLAAAVGDMPDSDEWEAIAATYAREHYVIAPSELLPELSADLLVLERMLDASDGWVATDLARSAGQLGVVMALTLAGLGQPRAAARWWQTARSAADLSEDTQTRVWVRAWEAVNGLYEGRPIPLLLNLVDETLSITKRPCAGVAGALAARAQALSLLGDQPAAIRALRQLEAVTEQMPGPVKADEQSLFGWPEFRLRHTESYVLSHLGDTKAAYRAQDRCFDIYPAELARAKAMVQLHRARCLVLADDIAAGLGYGMRVLVELPEQYHTKMLYEIAGHVLSALPANEQSRPAAADFRALLNRPILGQ